MKVLFWIVENWLSVLTSIGIVGGLVFNGINSRSQTKSQQVANLLTLTKSHREIWMEYSRNPKLQRVLDPYVDLTKYPLTREEEQFMNWVILHLNSAYQAGVNGLMLNIEGMSFDVAQFFSLPIPAATWEKMKIFQNKNFTAFVEKCVSS